MAMDHGASLGWRDRPMLKRAAYPVMRRLGRCALSAEIAVSDVAAGALERLPHAPIVVVHNGIDTDHFCSRPLTDCPPKVLGHRFGIVTRLVPGKGVDIAISAMAHAARFGAEASDFHLVIAGTGPDAPRLEGLVNSLGLRDHVRIVGEVRDVPAFWVRRLRISWTRVCESISVREKGQSCQRRTHSPRVSWSPWGRSLPDSAGALLASVRWR